MSASPSPSSDGKHIGSGSDHSMDGARNQDTTVTVAYSPDGKEAVSPRNGSVDGSTHKRKRSRSHSREADVVLATSRRRSRSPPTKVRIDVPRVQDVDPIRRAERERQLAARIAAMELEKEEKAKEPPKDKDFDAKAEFAKLVGSRSGGVYMPPARLRALQQAASGDKASAEYQRLSWDALRKSITGIVNRVNIANIKQIVPELFAENLIRGRGLFARSIMKAQAASLPFTPVFAAVVAIINTKLPQVGELVLTRLISQFRRSFKRNDKIVCHSTTTFIAHLVNQAVAHEIVALQILVLLLERPTDDSIEIAVGFTREVGAFLAENSPKGNATVFERFRAVLNEGHISQRVQYMIEVLMQVRKDKYKDNPILPEGLDLVEEEEQITHQIQLEEDLQVQEGLNIFKLDPKYLESEEKYKEIKTEILGEESDEEAGSEESDDESEEEAVAEKEGIEDRTETNLVNLRRIIYLTIMNALNYEEAVHKLLKVQLQDGQEIEMVNMIIECCSQERSYSTFYGLVGERFSKLNRVWTESFEVAFANYYTTIHRYETNRLRNIARFFGHLIASDSVSWTILECVHINEEDTTSSSRIFVKIMMGEMMESMGLKVLAERFKDEEIKKACVGMFPMDVPKNTRFSINYFTSVGLGILTEDMREYLKNAPKIIMEQRRAMLEAESSSSSDSSSSDSSSEADTSSDSDSDSSEDSPKRGTRRRRSSTPPRRPRDDPQSPPPRNARGRDDSPPLRRVRDDSPPPRRVRDDSPPPRRPRDDSPPLRRARDDSPPPRRLRNDSPPPRRPRNDSPPPRRFRDASPPRRPRDDSPPRRPRGVSPRRPVDDSPPPRRVRDDSLPRRVRDDSPPLRRARDDPPPPRRNGRYPSRSASPPLRHKDSYQDDRKPDVRRPTNGRERDSPPHHRKRSPSPPPPRSRYQERSLSPPPRRARGDSRDGEKKRDDSWEREKHRRPSPPRRDRRGDSRERERYDRRR